MKLDKNNKAWAILREDEQASLFLQFGLEKSSWQGGEIMKKSHYKYLEIKDRSARYLKLFTDHFKLTGGELIPSNVDISDEFRMYLEGAIMERLTIKEIVALKPLKRFLRSKHRNPEIVKEMKLLRDSPKEINRYIYGIIQEFDKWNNFRILPREIREPSAFKRRQKTRYKKHLVNYTNLKKASVDYICDLYDVKDNPFKMKFGYSLLVYVDDQSGGARVKRETKSIKVILNKANKAKLSEWGIYIFLKRDIDEFTELIHEYLDQPVKSPAYGLSFWPRYRAIIQRAINFHEVSNIVIYRRGNSL